MQLIHDLLEVAAVTILVGGAAFWVCVALVRGGRG